jgi:hypothetical protein
MTGPVGRMLAFTNGKVLLYWSIRIVNLYPALKDGTETSSGCSLNEAFNLIVGEGFPLLPLILVYRDAICLPKKTVLGLCAIARCPYVGRDIGYGTLPRFKLTTFRFAR